jgi:hypothetical protein
VANFWEKDPVVADQSTDSGGDWWKKDPLAEPPPPKPFEPPPYVLPPNPPPSEEVAPTPTTALTTEAVPAPAAAEPTIVAEPVAPTPLADIPTMPGVVVQPDQIPPSPEEKKKPDTLDLFNYHVANNFNRSLQGILRAVGDTPFAPLGEDDPGKKRVKDQLNSLADKLEGYRKSTLEKSFNAPTEEDLKSTAGQLAGAAASVSDLAAGGKTMIAKLAGQTYGESYQEAKKAGQSDEEAHKAASHATIMMAPVLAAYGAAGKVAGKTAEAILPEAAGALARFGVGGTAAALANLGVSTGTRLIEGQPAIGNLQQNATDVLFGLVPGAIEAMRGRPAKPGKPGAEPPPLPPLQPPEVPGFARVGTDETRYMPPTGPAEPPTGRTEPPTVPVEPPTAPPAAPTEPPVKIVAAADATWHPEPNQAGELGIVQPDGKVEYKKPDDLTPEQVRAIDANSRQRPGGIGSEADAAEAADKIAGLHFDGVQSMPPDVPYPDQLNFTIRDPKDPNNNTTFGVPWGTKPEELQARAQQKLADMQAGRQPAPVSDAPENVPLAGAAGPVRTSEMALRPDLMQYKESDDQTTGTNARDRIPDKYNPLYAGTLLLWEPINPLKYGLRPGQRYIVANGHHRFERAVTDGIQQQNAQVIREADGYSASDARTEAAIANIKDGKGTIYDSTRLIREQIASRGEDEALDLARQIGARGRQAETIARFATDDLYAAFVNEKISPEAAAVIAGVAPANPGLQRLGIQEALTGAKPQDIANYLAALKTSPKMGANPTAEQTDLFGNDDAALEAGKAQAKRASALQREIKEQIATVRGAAKRPEKAAELGVDVRDPAALQAKIAQLAQWAERADPTRWHLDPQIRDLIVNHDFTPTEMLKQLAAADAAAVAAANIPPAPAEPAPGPQEEAAPGPWEPYTQAEYDALKSAKKKPGYVEAEQFAFQDLESQAFNLVGEETTDGEALQKERELSAEKARLAREAQNMGQTDLFEEPAPPKPGEEVSDVIEEAAPGRSLKVGDVVDTPYGRGVVRHVGDKMVGVSIREPGQTHGKIRLLNPEKEEIIRRPTTSLGEPQPIEEAAPPIGPPAAEAPPRGPQEPPPVPPQAEPPPVPRPEPADDPNFTAMPIEMPELFRFSKELLGTAMKVRKKLRALKGEALGVFRYTQGPKGEGEIHLKADIADLLTPEEKQGLRDQAETWAENMGGPSTSAKDKARMAEQRYQHLLEQAYELAKTRPPVLAWKVISHEIGHAVDWFSDKMIRGRGNFFGHIASLKNYLEHVIPLEPPTPGGKPIDYKEKRKLQKEAEKQLRNEMGPIKDVVSTILTDEPIYRNTGITPADVIAMFGMDARETMPELYKWFAEQPADVKKEIVRAAMKGMLDPRVLAGAGTKAEIIGTRKVEKTVHQKVGREPTQREIQERFRQLFKEELKRRNLAELNLVKEEVKSAIAWWNKTAKMPEYYNTPTEMYAEAFSIFLNNPAALAKRAPTYSRLIWSYMDNRPEVAEIYRKIQNQIRAGHAADESERLMLDDWDKSDKESLEKMRNRIQRSGPGSSFGDNVYYHTVDRWGPTYRAADGTPHEGKVRETVGNLIYREAGHELMLNLLNREVGRPIARQGMETRSEMGLYMFYNRIKHERFNLFNPYAITSDRAIKRLDRQRQALGEKRWAVLAKAHEQMRQIFEDHVLNPMEAERMWGPELTEKIRENIYYATYDVRPETTGNDGIERMMQQRYGNDGPTIYRQIGTVKEIKNPFHATILKMLSLMDATARNAAKREVVEMLKNVHGDKGAMKANAQLMKTADGKVYWQQQRFENRDVGTITYLEDGKKQMYYVPRLIADAFNKGNPVENRLLLQGMKVNNALKAGYTQWNYGFWPVNLIRDVGGWWLKMPGFLTPLHWGDEFPEAMRAARQSLKDRKPNVYADRFLQRRMALSRADPRGLGAGVNDEYELKLASYGSEPARWANEASKVSMFVKAWNSYKELGQVVERANKIAAMNYLDRHYADMPEWKKAEIVRERGGSPNFLARGQSSSYIDFFGGMFYNPWIQETRAIKHAAQDAPFSFTAKAVGLIAMPTMMQILAQAGAFGDDMKRKYRSIPDYDLSNYLVVPMFWVDPGTDKVAYMRLPLWEGGRILHQLLWHTFTGRGSDVAALWGGTLPNTNALIKTAMMWGEYQVFGNNPYDSWRGKNLFTDQQMKVVKGQGFTTRLTNWENNQVLLKETWNNLGGPLVYRFKNAVLDDPPTTRMEDFLNAPIVSNSLGRFFKVSSKGLNDLARQTGDPYESQRALVQQGVMEVQRKMQAGEALTKNEMMLMREPYAMDYWMRTTREHMKAQMIPDYKRFRGRPMEERMRIMEELTKARQ